MLLDVVYNHLGPVGNYLADFGPYFTDRYETPWGTAVNLDGPGSDEVRRFFVDNALMWLRDYHVDGLRLDAVHAIVDTSAVHILEELADGGRRAGRRARRPPRCSIAESDTQRPAAGPAASAAGRPRARRPVERRLPPRPPRRAHRGGGRLLRRLSAADGFAVLERAPAPGCYVYDGAVLAGTGTRSWAARSAT